MIFADTHVLVWLGNASDRLPADARDALLNDGFSISAVTAWEYADLHGRRRLPKAPFLDRLLDEFAAEVLFPGNPEDGVLDVGIRQHAVAADLAIICRLQAFSNGCQPDHVR